ncbi:MAG: transcription antitermination factor NusB [Thermodesulfovibrionales bacterium]
MIRRKAREYTLQMLFQYDFTGSRTAHGPAGEADDLSGSEGESVLSFAQELFRGTIEHLDAIDQAIQSAARHWQIERMAAVDRNIMRCAVYELLFRKDIPPAVTINEALEIAKKYSSQESVSFINGLLDTIFRETGRNATSAGGA